MRGVILSRFMIRPFSLSLILMAGSFVASTLTGCAGVGMTQPTSPVTPNFQRFAGQGIYVTPENLLPVLAPTLPPEDFCRSRLYLTLVGQHEGAIFIPGLPGRKRIVKPAELEDFEPDEDNDFLPRPPLVEVIDFLPQQSIYASSIRTVTDRFLLTDDDETRLTLELNREGYIEEVRCG